MNLIKQGDEKVFNLYKRWIKDKENDRIKAPCKQSIVRMSGREMFIINLNEYAMAKIQGM